MIAALLWIAKAWAALLLALAATIVVATLLAYVTFLQEERQRALPRPHHEGEDEDEDAYSALESYTQWPRPGDEPSTFITGRTDAEVADKLVRRT